MIRRKIDPTVLTAFSALFAAFAADAGEPGDLVFLDGFESAEIVTPDCAFADPMYPPEGYRAVVPRTLAQLWLDTSGNEIGGSPATIRLEGGEYASYAFDRAMLPAEFYEFRGDSSNVGFGLAPARFRYFTVTTCPADLRYESQAGVDFTIDACRRSASEGTFLYLNWGAPIPGACNVDPTRTYYLNVIFDDPRDGYQANEPCSFNQNAFACGFRISAFQ